MSVRKILENWMEYNDKKIRGGSDVRNFDCTEKWEVDYLVGKILGIYSVSEEKVKEAIALCCAELKSPHPREPFLKCVLNKLGLIV